MEKYEILIEDLNFQGLIALSIVDSPAIEENFIKFNKEGSKFYELAKVDDEKRIITGPALIPNKDIPRFDENGEKYVEYFSEDTIRKAVELFFKSGKNVNITLQHMMGVSDVVIFESWIIEDSLNDKSNKYGYTLPTGTWMVSMKVYNDDIWDLIKNDMIKGFSIEGWFSEKLIKNSKDITESEYYEEITKILREYITK